MYYFYASYSVPRAAIIKSCLIHVGTITHEYFSEDRLDRRLHNGNSSLCSCCLVAHKILERATRSIIIIMRTLRKLIVLAMAMVLIPSSTLSLMPRARRLRKRKCPAGACSIAPRKQIVWRPLISRLRMLSRIWAVWPIARQKSWMRNIASWKERRLQSLILWRGSRWLFMPRNRVRAGTPLQLAEPASSLAGWLVEFKLAFPFSLAASLLTLKKDWHMISMMP